MAMTVITAGSLLTISTGEYSDYSVWGVFRALGDIDAEALRSEWLEAHPEQAEPYDFDERAFLAWVTTKGLLKAVESREWYLGAYGNASDMDVT